MQSESAPPQQALDENDSNNLSIAASAIREWHTQKSVYALVLRLTVGSLFKLHVDNGRLVHAAFLDMIRSIDPVLSQTLHSANERKPYTTSPVWGAGSLLKEGDEAFVRLTMLDPTLSGHFVQKFWLYGSAQRFELAGVPFAVTHVHITPEGHARAGMFPIQPLGSDDVKRIVRVDFLTPTAFSRNHGNQTKFETAMQPRELWNYARRQWEMAGGDSPGRVFDDWVEAHTEVLRMNTQRYWVDFPRFKIPGIVGYGVYKLAHCDPDEPNARWWRHFARFMPFSSLGAKTTMGLGQCVVSFED